MSKKSFGVSQDFTPLKQFPTLKELLDRYPHLRLLGFVKDRRRPQDTVAILKTGGHTAIRIRYTA